MEDIADAVRELVDRQRIWESLLRYTRGVDRLDRELMLSAFHEDAVIDQGSFKGTREALADWVLNYHRENQRFTQHLMTNHGCEISGDTAHAETHVVYFGTNPADSEAFAVGRYIDRLERRTSGWAITHRVCTTEGATDLVKNDLLEQMQPRPGSLAIPTRDKADPSYLRPLVIPGE